MWNPFRKNKEKKAKETLKSIIYCIKTLKECERSGLIYWQMKGKNLLIEQSLATLIMTRGEKSFLKFLNFAAQQKNAELLYDAYEQERISLETEAVRKANEATPHPLTEADIQRIRQNAREDICHIDMQNIMNAIHEFDIMIIRSNVVSSQDATQEGGQLVAVGHFDGKKVEMALWDDIKYDLQTQG